MDAAFKQVFSCLVRNDLIPGNSSTFMLCDLSTCVSQLASLETFPHPLDRRNTNACKRKSAKYRLPKIASVLRTGLLQ